MCIVVILKSDVIWRFKYKLSAVNGRHFVFLLYTYRTWSCCVMKFFLRTLTVNIIFIHF